MARCINTVEWFVSVCNQRVSTRKIGHVRVFRLLMPSPMARAFSSIKVRRRWPPQQTLSFSHHHPKHLDTLVYPLSCRAKEKLASLEARPLAALTPNPNPARPRLVSSSQSVVSIVF